MISKNLQFINYLFLKILHLLFYEIYLLDLSIESIFFHYYEIIHIIQVYFPFFKSYTAMHNINKFKNCSLKLFLLKNYYHNFFLRIKFHLILLMIMLNI